MREQRGIKAERKYLQMSPEMFVTADAGDVILSNVFKLNYCSSLRAYNQIMRAKKMLEREE